MTRGENPDLVPIANRDALALEYWIGAATLARLAGMTALNDDIAKLGALEIAPRGYSAICELALF